MTPTDRAVARIMDEWPKLAFHEDTTRDEREALARDIVNEALAEETRTSLKTIAACFEAHRSECKREVAAAYEDAAKIVDVWGAQRDVAKDIAAAIRARGREQK